MEKLNSQNTCKKRFALLLSLILFLSIIVFHCGSDDDKALDPTILTGDPGVPLHILGPPNGQPRILSASVKQGNPNDFRINSEVLSAAGGSPISGYTWSLANLSSFPMGTTVEPLTGIFKWNGTSMPVSAGSYPFSMTVSDGSTTATGNYILVVTEYSIVPTALFQQPSPLVFRLDTAIAGKSYGSSLFVTVGSSGPVSSNVYLPLKWEFASGDLPSGLTIDQHSGIVRGTPLSSASGNDYSFSIKVTNQQNEIAICPGGSCVLYKLYVK